MYMSEWDLHGAADYYQQLVPREKYTPRDMAFLRIYQNGIYVQRCDYYWRPDNGI
jgi:hypothetical protein